jgi:hypothetical protein
MSTQTVINGMDDFKKPDALAVPTPMKLIEMAMTQNLDADKLGQLMQLQMTWEANEARKAYLSALHAFRQNAPIILKTKKVEYLQVKYSHAELDKICDILIPELGKYGLSAGWNTSPTDGGKIRVACVLTHGPSGHRQVESTLDGPPDTTGSKNAVQAIGSTSSYLERYSLLSSLGIAPKGSDNDGRTSESLSERSVEDYLTSIRDAASIDELKANYEAAKEAANKLSDASAVKQFLDAKDKRYRVLKGMR